MDHQVELKDAFKRYTLDQDKICTPEETVNRFKEKLMEGWIYLYFSVYAGKMQKRP